MLLKTSLSGKWLFYQCLQGMYGYGRAIDDSSGSPFVPLTLYVLLILQCLYPSVTATVAQWIPEEEHEALLNSLSW